MTNAEAIDPQRIGKRLRELRERGGMTQRQVASATGSYPTIISRLERGSPKRPQTLDSIARYCSAIGVDVYEVFR